MSFHLIQEPRRRDARLVCYAASAKTKVRGLLREHGIRPNGRYFLPIVSMMEAIASIAAAGKRRPINPPRVKTCLAVYNLTGDAWLAIRNLDLPTTTQERLNQFLLGYCSAGQAFPL